MDDKLEEKKNPAISVVIPCFRAGELLAQSIESVLAQTETDWELILVDNNASEETKAVIGGYVKKFPEKIRSVLEAEQGNSSARNTGILNSCGEYIAFLDDDDLMYADRLSLQRKKLEESSKAVLCFGRLDKVSFDNRLVVEPLCLDSMFYHFPLASQYIPPTQVILSFPEPRPSSILVKKSILTKIGCFDNHFNPFFLEETEIYMRLAQEGEFVHVDQSVIRYRLPNTDFLKKKRVNNVLKYRMVQNQDYFFSKTIRLLKKKGIHRDRRVLKDLRAWRTRWLRENSYDFLASRDGVDIARFFLWEAILNNPFDFASYKHMLRSFLPLWFRERVYPKVNIYEDVPPPQMTRVFIKNLFRGSHHCEFCAEVCS